MKPTQEQALDWAFECDFVESSPAEDVFSAIYVCCPKDIERLVILAYEAGRAALAQPEQEQVAWISNAEEVKGQFVEGRPRRVWWECNTGVGQPLYTAPPQRQPEPEPVAYINEFAGWSAPDNKNLDWHKDNNASRSTPLYPQREWQGLTQHDIDIAFDDTQEGGGFDDFARVIEAKLREKNEIR